MTTDPKIYDVSTPQEVHEGLQADLREMEKKTSAREAARTLLPMFLDGYFENCGDDMAQNADAYGVIENWLRGVAGMYEEPQPVMIRCWACKGTGGVRQPTNEPGVYESEPCPICNSH